MHIRFLTFALISFFVSPVGYAIGIGELTMRSGLGEPLHAQVDLQLARGEVIDASCISLSEVKDAESGAEDARVFLPAGWIVSLDRSGRKVEIRSRKPFNELFAIFSLKIKCRGMGSISKTLTLLPEFGETSAPQAVVSVAPGNANAPSHVAVQNDAMRISQPVTSDTPSTPSFRNAPPTAGTEPPQRKNKTTSKRAGHRGEKRNAQFGLKLSGEPLDLSHIGKMNVEDREALLAQQKLMDEDDQAARYLSMLHQMKLMQEELGALKLRLAGLEGGASWVAAPQAVIAPTPPLENKPIWGNGLMLLGWLAAISLTWLGLRYAVRNKLRVQQPDISAEEPSAKPEIRIPQPATAATSLIKHEKIAQASHAASAQPDMPVAQESPISKEESEVLEEAELYAVHGHPDKGVKILHEFVLQHPTSEKAWMLLLSICSSRGQVKAFESAARDFLRHNKNSPSWASIQVLGRTLDRANSLYTDKISPGASSPMSLCFTHPEHRLIGNILVELNYLSHHDMENCLKDFDSERHGRFGNYLVMRQQVSYAQLGEALMRQQASDGALRPDILPTLQQMEDLLKDFDPQRDGSVEEYLMSHQKSIAERLAQPIASEPHEIPDREPAQPADDRNKNKYFSEDFVLDFDLDAPATNKQPGSIAEDKSQPLEFYDLELSNHLALNNPRGV